MNAPATNVALPPAILRPPARSDGAALQQLIASCPPLDLNSTYAYLLLCEHHADTCVIAEADGQIAGAITGYRHPQRADTLFVWQVAVASDFRRQALAARMLEQLFANGSYRYLETTISPDNAPSHNLFRQFAERHGVALNTSPLFAAADFGSGNHQPEPLYRLGPWPQTNTEISNHPSTGAAS
jgi:L-2,4-diaminobutyric acid acetyltransferase